MRLLLRLFFQKDDGLSDTTSIFRNHLPVYTVDVTHSKRAYELMIFLRHIKRSSRPEMKAF